MVRIGASEQRSISAVKTCEDEHSCIVGFLPKHMVDVEGEVVGRFAIITKLCVGSNTAAKRAVDYHSVGAAHFALIE